jgi:predicted MFS family arabinose efflux permease
VVGIEVLNQSEKAASTSRLFLPALIFSSFATSTLGILTALFLIDMSKTFGVNRGIMGQTNTFASIVSVIFALVMGILSVRFSDRILLLTGMFSYSISAVGCYFAWNFNSILIFYSINGLAQAMIGPMTNALIGDYVALEKRATAIAWTVAAGSFAVVICAPIMGVLSSFGGWQAALLIFIIPISLIALLIAGASIPSAKQSPKVSGANDTYAESFTKIVSNKSAMGCLVGNVFRVAVASALLFYGTAFTIERFGLSIRFASIVILLIALFAALGSLTEQRVIRKRGRKASTVASVLLAGLFTISYTYAPSVRLSVALMSVAGWFDGLAASASTSLTLEQVPELRGTMMSLFAAFAGVGAAIGAGIGGLALIFFDYERLGIVLGSMGIIAAIIFKFSTVDPTRRTVTHKDHDAWRKELLSVEP